MIVTMMPAFWVMLLTTSIATMYGTNHDIVGLCGTGKYFTGLLEDSLKLLMTKWSTNDEQFANQVTDGVVYPRNADYYHRL